jgi:glutamyl-tRNA synthetase
MSDENASRPVRTRFAPSPTGHLHVGGARTALFCWAFARQHGGTFVLRIEDTDQKRSSEASARGLLEDLKWMGLDWDEGPEFEGCGGGDCGPYYQSERREFYDAAFERLIEAGHAYPAFETPDELAAKRAEAQAAKRPYRYDRAALELPEATVKQYLAEGRPHVLRLRVPDGDIVFQDVVRGEVRLAAGELEDFVIRKADGFPTYHFAVVVDDELMRITHVMRGQEHLYNTPKHVALQDLLGYQRPTYAHLSLIFNPDGSKMSKRDKDKALRTFVRDHGIMEAAAVDADTFTGWSGSKDTQLEHEMAEALAGELGLRLPEINVDDFRRSGYLPETLCNYLALLGWSPGGDIERFDTDLLVEKFTPERLVKSPAKFDRDKLLNFNLVRVQETDEDAFAAALHEHCARYAPEFIKRLSPEGFRLMADANRERSKTLADPLETSRFLIEPDDSIVYQSNKPVRKAMEKGEPTGWDNLDRVRGVLAAIDEADWTLEAIETAVREDADANAAGKLGSVAQPLRIAVSGGTVSPPIFDVLALLGRTSVLARIDRFLACRESLFVG